MAKAPAWTNTDPTGPLDTSYREYVAAVERLKVATKQYEEAQEAFAALRQAHAEAQALVAQAKGAFESAIAEASKP